jgi:hypothetical protein
MSGKAFRQAIDKALKDVMQPALAACGFQGRWPKLRRVVGDRLDLVEIRHSGSGGAFYVEIAQAPAGGMRVGAHVGLPPEKLTPGHCGTSWRVFPGDGGQGFVYGPKSYEASHGAPSDAPARAVAEAAVARFLETAEPWFSERRLGPVLGG